MDTKGTPTGPVPPYEANPSYGTPPPIQQNNSYPQPIQQYPQQQQQPYQSPMASPPVDPQKQEYYPQQQQQPVQHQQTMPVQQVSGYQTAVPLINLQEAAAPVDCPSCRTRALTRTEFHSGNTTNAWAALACVCLCLGCIPYLISGLKDVEHKCGHCGMLLATWHRSGRTVVHAHS